MNRKILRFYSGIGIFLVLFFSYFITINIDSGFNYQVKTRILGIIIFHNPFILGLYILVAIVLIINGSSVTRLTKQLKNK